MVFFWLGRLAIDRKRTPLILPASALATPRGPRVHTQSAPRARRPNPLCAPMARRHQPQSAQTQPLMRADGAPVQTPMRAGSAPYARLRRALHGAAMLAAPARTRSGIERRPGP